MSSIIVYGTLQIKRNPRQTTEGVSAEKRDIHADGTSARDLADGQESVIL